MAAWARLLGTAAAAHYFDGMPSKCPELGLVPPSHAASYRFCKLFCLSSVGGSVLAPSDSSLTVGLLFWTLSFKAFWGLLDLVFSRMMQYFPRRGGEFPLHPLTAAPVTDRSIERATCIEVFLGEPEDFFKYPRNFGLAPEAEAPPALSTLPVPPPSPSGNSDPVRGNRTGK